MEEGGEWEEVMEKGGKGWEEGKKEVMEKERHEE